MVQAAYHLPPGTHPDMAAWELLVPIMTDNTAGRLQKSLVDKQKAASVYGFNVAAADPGFVIFGAQLSPDQDLTTATNILLNELETLGSQTFTEQELERVRAKWLKNWELAFTDPEQVGVSLSETIALGDWRMFFFIRDRVRNVSLSDVQRVAQTWLVQANRTLATYIPTTDPVRAPAPQRVNVAEQLKAFQPGKAVARVAAFQAHPAHIENLTQRHQLPSGLRISLLRKPTRGQMVNATLFLQTGNAQALRGRTVAAALLPALLKKGAGDMNREQIEDRLTALKAELHFSGGAEGMTATITTQEPYLPEVIALMGVLLRQPQLPESALEEVRQQALTDLQQAQTEPQSLVSQALQRALNTYPADDVRHVPTYTEQAEMLRRVQVADLRAYHQTFWGSSFGQFSAVGSFDEAAVLKALHMAFDGWHTPTPYTYISRPNPTLTADTQVLSVPDKANAVLGMVLPLAIRELDAEHAALLVANYIWGGSGHSRLWTRIREKEGLSYDVRSQLSLNSQESASQWSVSAIFAPQNLAAVQQAISQELVQSLQQGFTAAEVTAAQQGILRMRQHARAQDEVLARSLANNDFLNRNFLVSQALDDAIQKVTLAEVNAAWKKYIQPSAMLQVVAGTWPK
jgi:zinc protease